MSKPEGVAVSDPPEALTSRLGGDPTWRDHLDRPVHVPAPPGGDDEPFATAMGTWQGAHYDRNAFTSGTAGEVDALVDRTALVPGRRVLDVGCGTGRHGRVLARRGIDGVGLDVSEALLSVARRGMAADADEALVAAGPGGPMGPRRGTWAFVAGDARHLGPVLVRHGLEATFDVAWSLCQGGFGTDPGAEGAIVEGLATAVRPGGHVVLTAFHALFAVRHLVPGDAFDPERLVHHQHSEVRGPDHRRRTFDLWTVSHTVRDLHRLAADAGLDVVRIDGAEPGAYGREGVNLDDPELLAVLRRPVPADPSAAQVDDATTAAVARARPRRDDPPGRSRVERPGVERPGVERPGGRHARVATPGLATPGLATPDVTAATASGVARRARR